MVGVKGGGRGVGDPCEPGQPGKDPRSAAGVDLFYNLCLMLHF